MTPPQKLAHVVFRTNDLATMKSWYETVLEATAMFANDKLAFLTYDDEHHRLALIATEEYTPKPATTSVGFYHVAFTYGGLGELLDTYERLAAEGILPTRTINHGPTLSFYYRDPDGNDVELQIDRFATSDEVTDWIGKGYFAQDQIGKLVEPADLRRRLEGGEPVASILRRADEIDQP